MTRDQAFLPILMAALAVASLSLMDAFMKSAALAVGALTAAWLRSLLATGIALPLWLVRGGRWPRREVLLLHLQRSTVATFMALTRACDFAARPELPRHHRPGPDRARPYGPGRLNAPPHRNVHGAATRGVLA